MARNTNRANEWRINNTEKYKSISKHWRDNSERGYWSKKIATLRANSRNRGGMECTLSVDDLMKMYEDQQGLCSISGRILEKTNKRSLNSLSIDRIDGSIGYIVSNIRMVCLQVNVARLFGSDEELFVLCTDILAWREKSLSI